MIHRSTRRLSGLIIVVLVAIILSLAFATVAQAQTSGPVVTNLLDNGTGSLRDAVAIANPGDTITFAPGLTGTILLNSRIDINKNLTIAGPGIGKISISGGHILYVGIFGVSVGSNVTIRGLTIRDGYDNVGGGIYNRGTLTVESVEFGNNAAIAGGGAIYNNEVATLTVRGGKFIANAALMGGAILNNNNLTVEGSTFASNQASDGDGVGGAIANLGTMTITKSSLYSNSADRGGAIYSQNLASITGSSLSGNQGFTDGGALAISGGTASISSSCIKGNTTPPSSPTIPAFDAQQMNTGILTANDNWWGQPTGPNTLSADTTNAVVTSFMTGPAPACQPHSHDGANPGHGDDYAIIFPASDNTGKPALHIYCVNEKGNGYLGLIVTQATIDDKYPEPEELEENVKIADTNKCRVYVGFYLLTTGEYQVNIGPKPNGDVAVIIFSGMPPDHVYFRDFNIFDLEWPIEVPPAQSPVLSTVTPEATP